MTEKPNKIQEIDETRLTSRLQGFWDQIYAYLRGRGKLQKLRVTQIILLTVTTFIVSFSLIFPSFAHLELNLSSEGPWGISRNAPEDIIAILDIEFLLEKQYEKAQEEAARQTPLHFKRDFGALKKFEKGKEGERRKNSFQELLSRDIRNLRICRAANKQELSVSQCVHAKNRRWQRLQAADWQNLLRFSSSNINGKLEKLVNAIFENYIILRNEEDDTLYKEFKGSTVRVHDIKQGAGEELDMPWEKVIVRKQLYYDANLRTEIKELARDALPETSPQQRYAFLKLARAYLYGLDACHFDKSDTLLAQKKQRSQVPLADYVFQIKRGESIVRSGDVITENIHRALEVQQSDRWWEILRRLFSILAQQGIFLAFAIYYILRFRDKRVNDMNSNLVIFATLWLFALLLLFVENLWVENLKENEISHFFGAWVPIALFSLLLALSFGERLSIPLALYMAFLVFIASRYDPISLIIAITLSLTGIILGIRIKKRVHFISVSFILAFLSLVLVTLGYLYTNRDIFAAYEQESILTENFAEALQAAILCALSTLLVLGLLPAYETLFNIPTRFKLMELADPSHPLLQQLFQRAPSTWMHTMMVASLTEKACEKLGLNSILARTGIYFHDIGKMVNAGFFIENQHLIPKPENIDKNNPSLAAKVVIAHVLDGVKMAKAARLPQEVIDFIPEHHGTSTMSFFYHKALQKERRKVRKEDFQYHGPKPQSKETAIAMIADSVEAASRSLPSYTKDTLLNLIQRIINIKMQENQFDECDLSIRDLSVIRSAFLEVLLSSFHARPKYPNKQETSMLEKKRQGSAPRKKARPTKKSVKAQHKKKRRRGQK